MTDIFTILAAGLLIAGVCWFLKNYRCTRIDETPETFRRGRGGWGRRGWGRGWRGGYPYGWGGYYPYVTYVDADINRNGDCIPSTETETCPSSRPLKIGLDSNGNGVVDSWKCCN